MLYINGVPDADNIGLFRPNGSRFWGIACGLDRPGNKTPIRLAENLDPVMFDPFGLNKNPLESLTVWRKKDLAGTQFSIRFRFCGLVSKTSRKCVPNASF